MQSKKERLDLRQNNDKTKQNKQTKRFKKTEIDKNLSPTRNKLQSNLEKRVHRKGKPPSGTHGKTSHFVPILCL